MTAPQMRGEKQLTYSLLQFLEVGDFYFLYTLFYIITVKIKTNCGAAKPSYKIRGKKPVLHRCMSTVYGGIGRGPLFTANRF